MWTCFCPIWTTFKFALTAKRDIYICLIKDMWMDIVKKMIMAVSANLKVVHIGPKNVHIGYILVQATPKKGLGWQ